ncbi:MAG TPA: PKD domain-containing protein [Mucilaginibacter sp.]|nr:PKD domain-containing protein [Mucilaginibacter sp.]
MKLAFTFSTASLKFFGVLLGAILLYSSSLAQTVTITSPANGSSFAYGSSISITATGTASSSSYYVSSIKFTISGTTLSYTSTTGPTYSPNSTFNSGVSALSIGTYTLNATVKDSHNRTATTSIDFNIVPAAPTATGGATCGGTTVTLTASGGSPSGGTYQWYSTSTSSTVLATGATYTPTVTATKTYYVSYKSGSYESSRTAVTATYSAAPTSTFTATSSVNVGSNATITYTGSDGSSSTYTWNFDGGTIQSGSGKGPYTVSWSVPGTHNVTLIVTNSAGCSSSTTTVPVTVNAVALSDYGFSKALILNSSQITNGGISSTLTNFPALVYIQDDALKTGNACGDKVQFPLGNGGGLTAGTNYDFAFTKTGSTTELNYQVDTYDSINGILFCWVKIPSLTSANYPLTFYFGSKNPAHSSSFSAATWASDYKAVYHFNEASTNATVLDATSNGRNAVQANTSVTNDEIHIAAGVPIPGGGYSFNGSSTSIIQNAGTNPDITDKFTLSAWVYYNGDATSDNKIISNEINYTQGYKLSVKYGKLETETRYIGGDGVGNLGTGGAVSSKTWHYIQGVFTGGTSGTFINYVDGVAVPSSSMTYRMQRTDIRPDAGDVAQMGIDYLKKTTDPNDASRATNWYNGYMDEVRISSDVKSADWIRAEYYNQTQPLDFTNYSASVVSFKDNAPLLTGALTYTWTGLDSSSPTDQSKANNWDAGDVPVFNGNTKMNIPVVASGVYPVLTADAGIYSLTIADGATLNLNGHTLSVGCNIYNNATTGGKGILNASNTSSGVTWNGTISAQYYYGKNVKNTAEIGNMTVNNSSGGTITLTGGPVDIYNTITLTKGNLVVDNSGNGDLTLKSSSSITASVAAIPSSYSITGLVNVERYISGGAFKYRGYRFLSSPVYTAKSGTNYYYDLSYLKTYTPITGTQGTTGGMDKTGNPTIYLYRDNVAFTNGSFNGGNFRGVNTINNSPLYHLGIDYDGAFDLHVGTGFWFFYRGNRDNIATKYITTTTAEPNVFVSRGTLNQQSVTVVNWYTQAPTLQWTQVTGNDGYSGYNLVGNPYASSIDWNSRSSTNTNAGIYAPSVSNTIYIYNESTKVYGTYDGSNGINGASNIIPSGQGFYVKATNASAKLVFNEAAKTSSQVTGPTAATGSTLLLSTKPMSGDNTSLEYMRLELFKDSDNVEETIVRFDNTASNKYVDGEDSEHITGGGGVSFSSSSSDNVSLAINRIPYPKIIGTVVGLNVNATASGQYSIHRTELRNIPDLYEIWLLDAFKKDSLDLKNNSGYTFYINKADTNTFGSHRFSLIIRQNPALALRLLDFTAKKTSSGAQLNWKTENEKYYTNFTIERSTDGGETYKVLGGFASTDDGIYSFLDKNPDVAANTYRLKLEDLNGTVTYSDPVTLMYGHVADVNNNAVNIYPNPAVNTINVAISQNNVNLNKGSNQSYRINVTNSSGKILKSVTVSRPDWQDNVSNLLPGTYVVDVINNTNNTAVGQAKFIKL